METKPVKQIKFKNTMNFLIMVTIMCVSAAFITKVSAHETGDADNSEIQGTWKLISYNHVGESTLQEASTAVDRIKIINEDSFCWLDVGAANHMVSRSAGGSYTINDGKYVEHIEFGSPGMVDYAGKDQVFDVKIENNKMHLSGALSSGLRITEVWEKVSK